MADAHSTSDLVSLLRELVARHRMGHCERYDMDADAFYAETHLIAPGRSVPIAMNAGSDYERRREEQWDAWTKARAERWVAAMARAADLLDWQPIEDAPKDGTVFYIDHSRGVRRAWYGSGSGSLYYEAPGRGEVVDEVITRFKLLDAMLIRPIVDGESIDLHPLSEEAEPDKAALMERVEWLEEQLGLVYDYITHGKLSKPYAFKSVQADIDDAITEHVMEAVKDERESLSADAVSHEMGEPIGTLVYEDGSPISQYCPKNPNGVHCWNFADGSGGACLNCGATR